MLTMALMLNVNAFSDIKLEQRLLDKQLHTCEADAEWRLGLTAQITFLRELPESLESPETRRVAAVSDSLIG
jgi:hypothetical protein